MAYCFSTVKCGIRYVVNHRLFCGCLFEARFVSPAGHPWGWFLYRRGHDCNRFLQGWDRGDETGERQSKLSRIPHKTLLPGLQFILAGIIGRPTSFFKVTAFRFTYELLSYMYVYDSNHGCDRHIYMLSPQFWYILQVEW